MFTFGSLLACFQIDADDAVFRRASHTKMRACIEKVFSRLSGGDIDVHLMARPGGWVSLGVERCTGR
jgi:hypothetical protein